PPQHEVCECQAVTHLILRSPPQAGVSTSLPRLDRGTHNRSARGRVGSERRRRQSVNGSTRMSEPAKTTMAKGDKAAAFDWSDPFLIEDQLSEDERMIRDAARDYAQGKLMPRVREAYRNESFDRAIMTELGEIGFLGSTIPEEYGGAGASYVAYGLVAREVER